MQELAASRWVYMEGFLEEEGGVFALNPKDGIGEVVIGRWSGNGLGQWGRGCRREGGSGAKPHGPVVQLCATWSDFTPTMSSDRSQLLKTFYCRVPLYKVFKKRQPELEPLEAHI